MIYCSVSRNWVWTVYHKIGAKHVKHRLYNLQRHRGAYIVPEPDFVWSVNGYMKFRYFGLKIYAAIDAYSRYIIWIYVEVTSATAVSVLTQYLLVVKKKGQAPHFIRSDHEGETSLMTDTQLCFHKDVEENTKLKNCYMFETSTANQRIESWWGHLTKHHLYKYRVSLAHVLSFVWSVW